MDENNRGIFKEPTTTGMYERGTNHFLGISIDAYNAPFKALRNCVNDVTAVHKVLKEDYDFDEENMRLLCNEAATRRDILRTLHETLKKIGENDSLVFMYSGHGENLDGTNVGFMIPQDAAFEEDYINLSDIKSRLDASKAKHIFVIFDACFSGLILTQRDVRKFNVPENIPSRFALTSGRNSPVSDGTGNNSPFATALIQELQQNQDSLGAGLLSQKILDRFRETGKDEDQLPNFGRINEDIKYQGQYYFYPKNYELSLARERTKRLEAEDARKVAEVALMTAERERKRAEKLARAASNAAAFMQTREYDVTLSLRMMQYNMQRHPESRISFDMYNRTLVSQSPLYAKILRGHRGVVTSVAFSSDGQKALTGSYDTDTRLWDVATGILEKTFEGAGSFVVSVAFSPDDMKVLTSSEDSIIRLWDIEKGEIEHTFEPKSVGITVAVFSPDGKKIAVGTKDKKVIIWDITKTKPEKTINAHEDEVSTVVFSPDSKQLLSSSMDRTAKLWNMATGKLEKTFAEHELGLTSGCFSPDGKKILTGSLDKTAILWDVATGQSIKTFWGNAKAIYTVAFSPVEEQILTGFHDGAFKLWDSTTGQSLNTFKGHYGTVTSLAFSPPSTRGKYILSGAADAKAMLWLTSPPTAETILGDHVAVVNYVRFSPDGKKLLSIGEPNEAFIWDLPPIQKPIILAEDVDMYFGAHNSPDGKMILVGFQGNAIKLWDITAEEPEHLEDIEVGEVAENLFTVLLSPDGTKILVITLDYKTIIWDRANKTQLSALVENEEGIDIGTVAFSYDSQKIVTGSKSDNTVKIWDVTTGALLLTFLEHEFSPSVVAFSPDGLHIASCCADKPAILWNALTGEVEKTLMGHSTGISSIVFSSDGKQILTGSWDNTAKIWNAETGEVEKTFVCSGDAVQSVAFSPDETKIALGSYEHFIEIWDIATGSLEENIAPFYLFEMAEAGLTLETSDTPQYMDEFVAYVLEMGVPISDAIEMAERHLKDAVALTEFKARLGE